jgi:hypothetical protein
MRRIQPYAVKAAEQSLRGEKPTIDLAKINAELEQLPSYPDDRWDWGD